MSGGVNVQVCEVAACVCMVAGTLVQTEPSGGR